MHCFVPIAMLVASAISAHGDSSCLSRHQASEIISGYTQLLEYPTGPNFNSTANALLAPDFVVFSDSINFLSSHFSNTTFQPGTPAYTSRAEFIQAQAHTPAIPVLTTRSFFHNCNRIAWLWTGSGIGNSKEPVNGIITFNITGKQKIEAVYSEFNTGSWLVDTSA